MKIIYNTLIPFKGFKAINLFGLLFVRKGKVMREKDLNHERIHTEQMKELLYVFFYLWYVIEWLCKLPFGSAYKSISFEQEVYDNDDNLNYLSCRKRYSWLSNVFKVVHK